MTELRIVLGRSSRRKPLFRSRVGSAETRESIVQHPALEHFYFVRVPWNRVTGNVSKPLCRHAFSLRHCWNWRIGPRSNRQRHFDGRNWKAPEHPLWLQPHGYARGDTPLLPVPVASRDCFRKTRALQVELGSNSTSSGARGWFSRVWVRIRPARQPGYPGVRDGIRNGI